MLIFDITLQMRVPTLNDMIRMHFRKRAKLLKEVAWQVRLEAGPPPTEPFKRVKVAVFRESTQEPDPDGIRATAKPILDVLQPCSKKHPVGLGWIIEDSAQCVVDLKVHHVKGVAQRTRVVLESVDE